MNYLRYSRDRVRKRATRTRIAGELSINSSMREKRYTCCLRLQTLRVMSLRAIGDQT